MTIEFKSNNRRASFIPLTFLSALLLATLALLALVPMLAGQQGWMWAPVAAMAAVFAPLIWILARQAFDRRPVLTSGATRRNLHLLKPADQQTALDTLAALAARTRSGRPR